MRSILHKLFPHTHPARLFAHRFSNWCIALWYFFPARKLEVIAVTGTDGKTTTVAMIAHILQAQGVKYGAVSTAFFEVNGQREPNPTQKTSVSSRLLQQFLSRLVQRGCTHVVIEASSHGLAQGRLAGIHPSIAVITNISDEHLDYHGTLEEYIEAKGLLFRKLCRGGTKILNKDDQSFAQLSQIKTSQSIYYSPKLQLHELRTESGCTKATVAYEGRTLSLSLHLHGLFNAYNALAALAAARALGIPPEESVHSLESFQGAGGRMEEVSAGQPFRIFIDFTVTPNAYEKTLHSVRELAKEHKLIVVTGSCGDRMKEKRPIIGAMCTKLSDITIVTNEDPYTEDPEKIIDDVLRGVPSTMKVLRGVATHDVHLLGHQKICIRESDRRTAIHLALQLASEGDIVLLCGKGSDTTMMTATGQVPWNEKQVVLELLKKSSK